MSIAISKRIIQGSSLKGPKKMLFSLAGIDITAFKRSYDKTNLDTDVASTSVLIFIYLPRLLGIEHLYGPCSHSE